MDFKREVIELLASHIPLKKEQIHNLLEVPKNPEMGDYAFPCFSLAPLMRKSPNEIARVIAENIGSSERLIVTALNAYINFSINKTLLAEDVIKKVLISEKENYGKNSHGSFKKIVIDMSSPNIAKPFGIGHLRSTIIGNSIANICEFNGYKAVKINYLGDWGTQFGKILFAYKKFGKLSKLKKEPIKYLLELYVKAEKYEDEAREWFKKLEDGDKEAVKLWKIFRKLSMEEFNKLYKILGVTFDEISGESFYNKESKKVIELLREKKLLEESQDALIVDLNNYGFGVFLIQKKDGTTLYSTRDLTAAIDRHEKNHFDRMIYEVGSEQKLYFQQLFKVLELLGCRWADKCIHVEHGLYLDKDGKKFATRKGKTIFMEDIINETKELAKKEILKRTKMKKKALEKRALQIAISAIFFGDLKNFRGNDVVFDIDRFVSFEGDTGPYLQYSYARASSILKKVKAKEKLTGKVEFSSLNEQEIALIKKLGEFPGVVIKAYAGFDPSIVTSYSLQLAHSFNEFYQTSPVIKAPAEKKKARIAMVSAYRQVLGNSLRLLGLKPMEKM
jgi:arginyl-tRNA synthetase